MKTRDYDHIYDKNTGSTETHVAVDEKIQNSESEQTSFEEGFASASGIRPETAESGGRIRNPERQDAALIDPVPASIEEENSGLADD